MRAPFVKVEATKFTEVGYVGRDVESIIRDLVEASIRMVKQERYDMVTERAKANAEQRLVDILMGDGKKKQDANPLAMLFTNTPQLQAAKEETPEEKQQKLSKREQVEYALRGGALENKIVEIQVEDNSGIGIEIAGVSADMNMGDMFSGILPKKTKTRKVPVSEARKILIEEESDKLIDMDEVISTAITRAEQEGIVFLDEIDKIAGKTMGSGPDVSREGVQRGYSSHCGGLDRDDKVRPGKDRLYALYRSGRVSCVESFRFNS